MRWSLKTIAPHGVTQRAVGAFGSSILGGHICTCKASFDFMLLTHRAKYRLFAKCGGNTAGKLPSPVRLEDRNHTDT